MQIVTDLYTRVIAGICPFEGREGWIFKPSPSDPRSPPAATAATALSSPPCCVQAHALGWTSGPRAQLSAPSLAASGLTSSLQCYSWYPRAWCATSVALGRPPCPADSTFPPLALAPQPLLPPWHAQTLRRPAVPPVPFLNSRAAQLPSHTVLLPPPAPPQPLLLPPPLLLLRPRCRPLLPLCLAARNHWRALGRKRAAQAPLSP